MSNQPKMKLKLSTGQAVTGSKPSASQASTPSTAIRLNFSRASNAGSPPPAAAPSAVPASATLKIKRVSSAAGSPANSKKRARNDDTDELALPSVPSKKQATGAKITLSGKPPKAKTSVIKLKAVNGAKASPITPNPAQTRLKIKAKGKLPPRPLGVGYDSEAEDAELDPANEDNLILRMAPGPDCDYLRAVIEEKKVGLPVSQGGADVSMRFFTRDGRRAVVNVCGRHYAAILVDLPCIVESMKSWDKRGWWKSADICQMLLVVGQVETEEAAKTVPIPREVDTKTWQWPHGLTPPMHNARNRRFRKRVSNRTIEAAEEEVERLLAADEQAKAQHGRVEWKILDMDAMRREEAGEDGYDDEDAEGDADAEYALEDDDDEATAEAMALMEQALGADDDDEAGTPAIADPAPMPAVEAELEPNPDTATAPVDADAHTDTHAGTGDEEQPSQQAEAEQEAEPSPHSPSSSSSEDEEDDDPSASPSPSSSSAEIDEAAREAAQQLAQQREEISYLEQQLAMQREAYAKQENPLLRQRLVGKIKSYEADLQVKRRALGVGDDDG